MNQFKPYQIVVVTADGFQYNGQVMSFETPARTAIVRRVPGHPGTIEEMSTDKLRPLSGSGYHWVHYAKVAGRGSFPVDMLRYDHAAPVNFTFVKNERTHLESPVIDLSFGLDGLWIAALSNRRTPPWTDARWSSFMWGVKHEVTEDLRTGDFPQAEAH